ncbi:MAG: hypothetical protein ABJO27_01780 [Pseudoruegeria sp.]
MKEKPNIKKEDTMPEFALIYHGSPQFSSAQDGQDHMTRWKAWSAGLGDAMIVPGAPFGPSKTIQSDGSVQDGAPDPAAGYTVIEAADMDAAIALAKPCPHLDAGGTLEIAQTMDMEM